MILIERNGKGNAQSYPLMAWTDTCKIEACAHINRVKEQEGLSARKAIDAVAKETGINKSTLDQWYYPRNYAKNGVAKKDPVLKTQEQIWKSVAKRIEKLCDYISGTMFDARAAEYDNPWPHERDGKLGPYPADQ